MLNTSDVYRSALRDTLGVDYSASLCFKFLPCMGFHEKQHVRDIRGFQEVQVALFPRKDDCRED